jgi:hypothetical protein
LHVRAIGRLDPFNQWEKNEEKKTDDPTT